MICSELDVGLFCVQSGKIWISDQALSHCTIVRTRNVLEIDLLASALSYILFLRVLSRSCSHRTGHTILVRPVIKSSPIKLITSYSGFPVLVSHCLSVLLIILSSQSSKTHVHNPQWIRSNLAGSGWHLGFLVVSDGSGSFSCCDIWSSTRWVALIAVEEGFAQTVWRFLRFLQLFYTIDTICSTYLHEAHSKISLSFSHVRSYEAER